MGSRASRSADELEVMLVEDEPAHVALIRRAFQQDTLVRLTVAENLRDACRILAVFQPDIIVADLKLPDGEGTELLARCGRGNDCPVVIMTSYGDQDIAVEIMKAGASDYIVKSEPTLREIPAVVERVSREWRLIQGREKAIAEQARLITILEAAPDLIATTDVRGHFTYMNKAGRALLGIGPDEDISQLTLYDFHSPDEGLVTKNLGIPCAIKEGVWRTETNLVLRNNTTIASSQVIISHNDPQGNVEFFSTIIRDIQSVKEAEEKIEYLAFYDSLTGLPNRNELIRRLEMEMNRAVRHKRHGALLFIDLDNFKNINDSLGHPVGDKVLQDIARRLTTVVRGEDTVARLGGDEFVIILSGLSDDPIAAARQAEEISGKLRRKISLRTKIGKLSIQLTASIGIAMFLDDFHDPNELFRVADAAMYDAKAKGKDRFQVFNEGMDAHFGRFLAIESELRQAIRHQQFVLHYQPKFRVGKTKRLAGAEALIRWNHPARRLTFPIDFLDVLESSGMIIEVGCWVMREAFSQLCEWIRRGLWHSTERLSINISPRQFRDDNFVPQVIGLLRETGLSSECVDLEVTEQIVIHDMDETIAKMNTLTEAGITFSLDDFGTGYSSLSYLKRMPVSAMKIDRSFVLDIMTDKNDQALVDTMLAISNHLHIDAVAEGVETRDQLERLVSSHCRLFQGYYFSHPLPAGEFESLVIACRSAAVPTATSQTPVMD